MVATGSLGPLAMRIGEQVSGQRITPGTVRRILPYARPYRGAIVALLLCTVFDAVVTAFTPLVLESVIDQGIIPGRLAVVVGLSVTIAVLALADVVTVYLQTVLSARIGQGVIYDLRTKVFRHVQRQTLAFFTRTQTGSLVSRLNTDIVSAQQAVTSLLSQTLSTVLTLVLVLAAMFYLSWQISLVALALIPIFLLPGKAIARRLQRLARGTMQLDAEMSSLMNERFNVAGAMLTKLYGRPRRESELFASRAGRVRELAVVTAVHARALFMVVTLLTSLTTALVYGLGGGLVISHSLRIGTLVGMIALLARLYGPVSQLSNMQSYYLTALVSFDRVFELLDLKPLVAERPDAVTLTLPDGAAPDIEFDEVSFRYPAANEVSLASLESIALPAPERATNAGVLHRVSFRAPAGKLTALVGPSGAGKTTITHLVPRLYDPGSGAVRIAGHDIRDLTFESLQATVGVVSQDAHMFHDTIRANVAYARPEATEQELIEVCRAAQIWDTIAALPNGLDTVVGDSGYRLSGGEKQRLALARLLLKAPPVLVLDEATAHLDSESEAAVQRALATALAGRTSLVIAHRLSTIRHADQILVIEAGQVAERGTHDELLAAGGLYAELYLTQFAGQSDGSADQSEVARA